jgi:hypothetical protein
MALTQVKSEGIADGAVTPNDLADSGVTAGTYGSSSAIPAITVDAKGRVTSATTSAIDSTAITNGTSNVSVAASGDITATRAGTQRLAVTSSGIDVTGTVTCDGLTADGDVTIQNTTGVVVIKDNNNTGASSQNYISARSSDNAQQWYLGQTSGANSGLDFMQVQDGIMKFGTNNTFRAYFTSAGHFIPYLNNTYDLGTSSNQWRNAYFDGTVTCDGITSDGTSTFNGGAGAVTIATNSDIRFGATGSWTGDAVKIQHHNNYLYIGVGSSGIIFREGGTDRCKIDGDGHFVPGSNNTYDLGSSSFRWRNVYTNDLNLSNEGGANDVDGTWGSWTIQEGEDDLFLLNRRNGKKYKFNLSEVN